MSSNPKSDLFKISQALAKSNTELRKFRSVLDQAPGAVFILDKDFNFEYLNPCFTQLSGYTQEDLLHKNIRDTLYKGVEGVPESRKEIVENLLAGKSWQGELLTFNKNGSSYWANTIASPFRDKDGNIDGYVVIQQDVTEQKQMIIDLKEHERLHKTLIEDSLEGVVIVQDFKFIFINNVFSDLIGFTLEELNTMKPTDIIAEEDRERLIGYHRVRMQGLSGPKIYEASFVRKDGRRFTGEMSTSLIDLGGKPASFLTVRDVTEKRAFEQALRESELKYKTLVENSRDGIIIVRNNKILFANNTFCNMLQYPCEALNPFESIHFIHPDDRARALEISKRRTLGDNSTIHINLRLVRFDGAIIECDTYSSVINYQGEPASFFTIHNITDSKRMQAALEESERKYRTLIDKALDGIIITQQGKFKFINKAFCEMVQYDESELLGRNYLDIVVPEDHETMLNYHQRRMKGEDFQAIYRSQVIRKDGKLLNVELNSRTSEYEGKPASFVITRDITARMQTEEDLIKAKNELESLNNELEQRVAESSARLTEANTQLIRLQKENLQSQFEVLRQQVNPHFLFNSLNVLTSLIKLEPDLAEKFTEHLSKVYRYVLENKDYDLVSLHTELDFLDAYLFLLNIRFPDKLIVNINIPEDERDRQILPLALQLIIENAIKHNTMSKKSPLVIQIFIDGERMLNIVNNLQERETQMISTGVGLRNIAHRYELLELPSPVFRKTSKSFIAKIPLK